TWPAPTPGGRSVGVPPAMPAYAPAFFATTPAWQPERSLYAAGIRSQGESGLPEPRLNFIVNRLGFLGLRHRSQRLQRLLRHQLEPVGLIQFVKGEQIRLRFQALGGRQQESVARYAEFPGLQLLLRGRGIVRTADGSADAQQDAALQHRGLQQVALGIRSEEHTSELQSLTNLVCRLLLE